MSGVLRATEGAGEVGRKRTEGPVGRYMGEYLRYQLITRSCQIEVYINVIHDATPDRT